MAERALDSEESSAVEEHLQLCDYIHRYLRQDEFKQLKMILEGTKRISRRDQENVKDMWELWHRLSTSNAVRVGEYTCLLKAFDILNLRQLHGDVTLRAEEIKRLRASGSDQKAGYLEEQIEREGTPVCIITDRFSKKFTKLVEDVLRGFGCQVTICSDCITDDSSIYEHVKDSKRNIIILSRGMLKDLTQCGEGKVKVAAVLETMMVNGVSVLVLLHKVSRDKVPEIFSKFKIKDLPTSDTDRKRLEEMIRDHLTGNDKPRGFEFVNTGNGLAYSYFFGYLNMVLPKFEQTVKDSNVYRKDPDHVCTKMIIVFATDVYKPKGFKNRRMRNLPKGEFKPVEAERGGKHRSLYSEGRVLQDRRGQDWYAAVQYCNVVQTLHEMKDDIDRVTEMNEDTMRDEAKCCLDTLKLILDLSANKNIRNSYILLPYEEKEDPDSDSEDEDDEEEPGDDLVDQVIDCIQKDIADRKKKQSQPTRPLSSRRSARGEKMDVVVLCGDRGIYGGVERSIKRYSNVVDSTVDVDSFEETIESAGNAKILVVLTKEIYDWEWFSRALQKAVTDCNRRSLIVVMDKPLNALPEEMSKLKTVLSLYTFIVKGEEYWENSLKNAITGPPEDVLHDFQFHNSGRGLAYAYYYGYMKIKIPKLVDVISMSDLKTLVENRKMSHKLFVLLPQSCQEKPSLSDADPAIQSCEMRLPIVRMDRGTDKSRPYGSKVHKITDHNGEDYYFFAEFSAPMAVLYDMTMVMQTLRKAVHLEERKHFHETIERIMEHEKVRPNFDNRCRFVIYDDTVPDFKLSELLLEKVKEEIAKEDGRLPDSVDNGAKVEWLQDSK